MAYLILSRKSTVSLNLYRRISTELWKTELTTDTKKEIEDYWSKKLRYDNQFDRENLNNKFYVLSMFPYPSGNLHVGHVRVYTISDSIARFLRMNGKNVFQPMGWDSFGLPAENAALERGIAPHKWTEENIKQMKEQMKSLFCTFDWDAELSTCDPKYYRWTQYLFLKMFESGLAYRKEATVNWDPIDQTVLADEQVDEKGRSWRSGAVVEKKLLKQWFIRSTQFAKDLYDALDNENLDNWRDIIEIQKHWIGECDGFSFDFKLTSSAKDGDRFLNLWVSKPESIADAEFIAIKSTNPVYILFGSSKDADGKLDIEVTNPFTNCNLPIYVTEDLPYPVLRDVYVGVPSKSRTDREFAKRVNLKPRKMNITYGADEICKIALNKKIGGYPVSSKLQDWLISRQRYWGTPIPILYCDTCGTQPVPYDQLPVCLPPLPENHHIDKALKVFLKTSGWINTTCPKCGGAARRETDTMDTFVDSSWYYLRYVDVNNDKEPFDTNLVNRIMPVDLYVGGKEHAALHLYYARFIHHFLYSIRMVENKEPFKNLLCQGMVKGKTYKTKEGKYLKPDEVDVSGKYASSKKSGRNIDVLWEKMSKSRYNGVEPKEIIDEYGIDTTRMFLLNSVSPRLHFEWDEDDIEKVLLYQHRLWLTVREFLNVRSQPLAINFRNKNMGEKETILRQERNRCIGGATFHYEHSRDIAGALLYLEQFSATLRKTDLATREVRKYGEEYEKSLAALIIMLSPVIPHLAATLWFGFTSAPDRLIPNCEDIKWEANVMQQRWPEIDGDFEVPIYFKARSCPTFSVTTTNLHLKSLTLEEAVKFGANNENIKWLLDSDPHEIQLKIYDNCGAEVLLLLRTHKKLEFLNMMKNIKLKKKKKLNKVTF